MKRGRPIGSDIRQRMVDLLGVMGHGYGYEIHKVYCQIFHPCTREVVYYHLRTGVKLGLFIVEKVAQEKGSYSWGQTVEKTYYLLGPAAEPHATPAIEDFFKRKALEKRTESPATREDQTP